MPIGLTPFPLARRLWRSGAVIRFQLLARTTFGAIFRPTCVQSNVVALGSVGNRGRQSNKRGRSLAAARPRLEVTHRTCDGITETRGGESEALRRIRHRVQKRDGRSASETDAHPLRPPQRRTSGMRSQAWEPRPRVHFWGAPLPPSTIGQNGSAKTPNAAPTLRKAPRYERIVALDQAPRPELRPEGVSSLPRADAPCRSHRAGARW